MSTGNGGDIYTQAFAAQAKVQVDWLNALGQFALNEANARRAEAVATGDTAIAQVKLDEARQLELDMARVNSHRYQVQQQLAYANEHAKDLAQVMGGVDPVRAWMGWKYFLLHSNAAVQTKLCAMTASPAALRPENWTPPCGDALAGNVVQLAAWARKENTLPEEGSEAWQLFSRAVGVFTDAAQSQADAFNAACDAMAAGLYKTWDPLKLLSLPMDSPPQGGGNAGPAAAAAPKTPPKTA